MLRTVRLLLPLALLVACAAPGSSEGADGHDVELGLIESAISACDEMVPANRYIDGIPAYAQCASTEMSAIYSNNGIDTSTMKVGADWVRTQWSGGYQCTELASRYLKFVWDVKYVPNGNAGNWCDTPPPANSGMVQSMTPVHGDLIVFAPGSCGAAQGTGHVAVVDTVDMATQKVSVVEQNRARRGSYMISCAKCYLHVVANDGKTPPKRPAGSDGGALPPAGDPLPPDGGSMRPAWPRDAAVATGDAGVRDSGAAVDAGIQGDAGRKADAGDDEVDQSEEPIEGADDEGEPAASDDEEDGDGEEDGEAAEQADDGASNEGCALRGPASSPQSMLWLLLALLGRGLKRRER
jgi:surface antigen